MEVEVFSLEHWTKCQQFPKVVSTQWTQMLIYDNVRVRFVFVNPTSFTKCANIQSTFVLGPLPQGKGYEADYGMHTMPPFSRENGLKWEVVGRKMDGTGSIMHNDMYYTKIFMMMGLLQNGWWYALSSKFRLDFQSSFQWITYGLDADH